MLSYLIFIYCARSAQIVYTIDCENNKTLNGLSGIFSTSSTGVFAVCPENIRVPSCYYNTPFVIINFNSIDNQSSGTNLSLPMTFISNASQVKIDLQQIDTDSQSGFVNFTFDTRQPHQQLTSMVWDLNFFTQPYLKIYDQSKNFEGNFLQQYVNVSWIVYTDSRFTSALDKSQNLQIRGGDNFWIQLLIQVYTDSSLYNQDQNSYNITLDQGYIFDNLTQSTFPTITLDESKKYNNITNITGLGLDVKKIYRYNYIQNYTFQYPYSVIGGYFTITGKFTLQSIYVCIPQEYVFGTVQQLQDGTKSSQVGIFLSLSIFCLIIIFVCYLFRKQEKISLKPLTSEEQAQMELEEKEVFRKFLDRSKNVNFQEQQEQDNIPLV